MKTRVVKRKDEYPPRTKRETGAGNGRTRGRRRMKEGKKKEEREAETGNLDRVDHLLKP